MRVQLHSAFLSMAALAAGLAAACSPKERAPSSIDNSQLAAPGFEAGDALAKETRQRMTDLIAIEHALKLYAMGHVGNYPKTDGWQSYVSGENGPAGEAWVPRLAGRYMSVLPRDPALSEDPQGPQYIYKSDGESYKLLATGAGDCSTVVELAGIRIDPKRTDDSGCQAYGFWSTWGELF